MTQTIHRTLIFIFLVIQVNTFGQRFPSHIGFKGGLNIAGLNSNSSKTTIPDYNDKTILAFEIFIETKISKFLTFQPLGLEFSQQGARNNGFQPFLTTPKYFQYFAPGQIPKYLYANIEKDVKLNYFLLTSMLRLSTNSENNNLIRPFISAGFFTSDLLSATENLKGLSIVYKDKQQLQPLTNSQDNLYSSNNIKKNEHKLNVGLSCSVGLTIDIKKIRMYIEGGTKYGLININKDNEVGKNYIKSLDFSVGLSYNIGQVFSTKF